MARITPLPQAFSPTLVAGFRRPLTTTFDGSVSTRLIESLPDSARGCERGAPVAERPAVAVAVAVAAVTALLVAESCALALLMRSWSLPGSTPRTCAPARLLIRSVEVSGVPPGVNDPGTPGVGMIGA